MLGGCGVLRCCRGCQEGKLGLQSADLGGLAGQERVLEGGGWRARVRGCSGLRVRGGGGGAGALPALALGLGLGL
eukprot:1298794-Alexandrium_andersonii.AAC.1